MRRDLCELILAETLRRHVAGAGRAPGWLGGLADPAVAAALATIRAAPAESWTLDRLARAAGVSRSVLAERFHAACGHAPMRYLAHWRMQLAAARLAEGARLAEVARAVGYGSEAAFSRAFKRVTGQSPAAFRTGLDDGSGKRRPHAPT